MFMNCHLLPGLRLGARRGNSEAVGHLLGLCRWGRTAACCTLSSFPGDSGRGQAGWGGQDATQLLSPAVLTTCQQVWQAPWETIHEGGSSNVKEKSKGEVLVL